MSYKTNISNTTKQRRDQIQSRLDDFATFRWRGQDAFEICGAFIIAEKRGDLKFYNGPSFSNEYTKPQFSSSSGNLTGVSFNRQQITFKMGAYWFSIEEWQNFIDWINAYEVNYLTFTHSPNYGYLVKLAKIADSPRYIVGYENGEPRYYTEMDLTWDLQGDNCVRANSPYEWDYSESNNIGTFKFNSNSDTNSNSRLETPLLLTIPLSYIDSSASLSFSASYQNQKSINLFNISLNNLPYTNYKQSFQLKQQGLKFEESNIKEVTIIQKCWYEDIECIGVIINYQESGVDGLFYPNELQIITEEGNQSVYVYSILVVEDASNEFLKYFALSQKINNSPYNTNYKRGFQLKKQGLTFTESNIKEVIVTQKCWYGNIECTGVRITYTENGSDGLFYPNELQIDTLIDGTTEKISLNSFLIVEVVGDEFLKYFIPSQDVNDLLTQNIYLYSPTLQYDSETGVLLYTAGDTNWKLLQLNLMDGEGSYLVSNIYTTKYKLKGEISNYKFNLELKGLKLLDTPQLQIYERTNVI